MEMACEDALSENDESDESDETQNEEINPVVMKCRSNSRHNQESHLRHLYISNPVCSHFHILSHLMFPNGVHALVNNHPYNFELLNAILRSMKMSPLKNTKFHYHYVVLSEVADYIFNFCRYHLLPVVKSVTNKDTHIRAANELKLMGANIGCDENNWPAILLQDVMSTKLMLDNHVSTRVLEIRRSCNLCISKIFEYKKRDDVNQTRLRLILCDAERRYEEALNENRMLSEMLSENHTQASINQLKKDVVAMKEQLHTNDNIQENKKLLCQVDELKEMLADVLEKHNALKDKYRIASEKLLKMESQKRRKLAEQYVLMSGDTTATSVASTSPSAVKSLGLLGGTAPPVYWCDPKYNPNDTRALLTPCKVVGTTVTPIAGPSKLVQAVPFSTTPGASGESSQTVYTMSPSATNVSSSVGVPTTNIPK